MLTLLAAEPTTLQVVWYCLIAVLWIGYLVLEGYDYGVAMLLPFLGKNEKERRVIVNTIGPVWDGNEVWLLTAGGAMFAAFPGWYASLFSGLYLPLLLVLVGLILRGVAFEYRSKHPDTRYRNMLDWFATIGSFLPSLVFGVGFANFIIGLANDNLLWNGSFWGLFGPFALLGGVMLVILFMVHGAVFLCLKTAGSVRTKANGVIKLLGPIAVVLLATFVIFGNVLYPAANNHNLGSGASIAMWVTGLLAVAAAGFAVLMHSESGVQRRENLAFLGKIGRAHV